MLGPFLYMLMEVAQERNKPRIVRGNSLFHLLLPALLIISYTL